MAPNFKRLAASLSCFAVMAMTSSCIGVHLILGAAQHTKNKMPASGIGELQEQTGHPSRADFIRHWGNPYRKDSVDGSERWLYRSRYRRWRGLVVWAIVPLPLVIPAGRYKSTVVFSGDSTVSITGQVDREYGAGFFWSDAVGPRWMIGPSPLAKRPNP